MHYTIYDPATCIRSYAPCIRS